MAMKKLTELETLSAISDGAYVIVTDTVQDADGTDKERVRKVLVSTLLNALNNGLKNASEEIKSLKEQLEKGYVAELEAVDGGLKVVYSDGSEKVLDGIGGGSGVGFTSWNYDEDTHYLHIRDADGLDVLDPVYIPGGGGGAASGSKLTFTITSGGSVTTTEDAESIPVTVLFRSVDTVSDTETGSGTLQIFKGSTAVRAMTLTQGETTIDVKEFVTTGTNALKFVMTDSYGASATRPLTVTVESLTLAWNLEKTMKNSGDLTVYLTPNGSGEKTIRLLVDGSVYSTDTVTTTGRRLTKTITGLTHGAHTVEAYAELSVAGALLESNRISCCVAQIEEGDATPVVAAAVSAAQVAQFTTVSVVHRCIDPSENPAPVSYLVNGVVYKTDTLDQSETTWDYRPTTTGSITLGILCGTTLWEQAVQVTAIGAAVEEVTNGLACKVDPAAMPSLEEWSCGGYTLTPSDNFDFVNGGIVTDGDGVRCIRITAGTRLTLDYPLFGGDARRAGLEAKIIYKTTECSDKDAIIISCMSSGVGLTVQANKVTMTGNQTTAELSTCEGLKAELDLNIQPDTGDRLMQLWESASTFSYRQYAADEVFSQTEPESIVFGSDDADLYLYLFRAYTRDLTDEELKANYIFDGTSGADILDRHDRNDIYDGTGNIDVEKAAEKNPKAHFITVHADRMTVGKKDTVYGTISHIYAAGGGEHRFTAPMKMVVQGTSSVEHAETAGGNLKFTLTDGITLEDGTHKDGYAMHGEENSIPVTVLNYKKNIASEDHIVNMMCQEWYQRYQPTIRPERQADPRVRDCMEACMCAVFFHNTGSSAVKVGPDTVQPDETIFFGLGNLCTDKDAVEAYQYEPIVIEVKNNTEPQVRFKSAENVKVDGGNFEFRYLNTEVFSEEQAEALFQQLAAWVCSCDYTQATGEMMPETVTYGGQTYAADTEEYRKAKWKAELADHFDVPGLLFHHNDTLFHLLRDNRAKNMFFSYRTDTGTWSVKFNWDNDTGHCRNNEGYIDIEPGYLDFDTIGTADVFNGADNVLFTNLRECNWEELQAAYLDREAAGAWDIDDLYSYAMENQSSLCEALWIEDAEHNAIRTMQNLGTTAYLERATGRLRMHLKKSLTFQKVLVDSYYCATASTSDSASFRGYTPKEWTGVAPSGLFRLVPYTDMFINILAGSTKYRVRAYAGQETVIDISANLNDTEIYLRDAKWIKSIGDLSAMYLGQFEASKLVRNKRFLIGSSVEGYYNTNFTTATFDNCAKMEEVNMGGLINAKRAFDFSKNIYLKTIYTKGSGVTGLTFAKNGSLETAQLNAIASLYCSGLRNLSEISFEGMDNLTSLTIENCPRLDSYSLVAQAENLTHVRLLDIAWSTTIAGYDVLMRLHKIRGKDDDGYDTEHGVVTGAAYLSTISPSKLAELQEKVPEVEITYGAMLEEYTVTFKNDDGTVLYETTTERGGSVADPIAAGKITEPAKEPDVENVYSFWKWDTAFNYIVQDTTVTALYAAVTRTYTVRYLVDGVPQETYTVDAHGSCNFGGDDPTLGGYLFAGWDNQATDVVEDMEIHAVFIYPVLPESVKDMTEFDFLYSDDPEDNAAYTMEEFAGIILTGSAKTYFAKMDLAKIVPNSSAIADSAIIVQVEAFNHYRIADGSGEFAGISWGMVGILNANRQMNTSNTNAGGWPECKMRSWLNETLFPTLPPFWRSLIKKVVVLSSVGETKADIVQSEDWLYLRSHAEMGWDTSAVPYKNEVDAKAEEIALTVYTDNNSKIKKYYNGTGTAAGWWLRSPEASTSTSFRAVSTGGGAANSTASASYGVSFGFST